MPVDKINDAVCPSLFSALVTGYTGIHMLPASWNGSSFNHIEKISMVNKFLQDTVEDSEIILITDAHDVVFSFHHQV